MECPKCKGDVSKILLEVYGHCLSCEEKARKKIKIKSDAFIKIKNIERLIFFQKILGKGFIEWKKHSI